MRTSSSSLSPKLCYYHRWNSKLTKILAGDSDNIETTTGLVHRPSVIGPKQSLAHAVFRSKSVRSITKASDEPVCVEGE
jgi:hypothetical protein